MRDTLLQDFTLHGGSPAHQCPDVKTGHRYRKQPDRSQHRIASADIVRKNIAGIAFPHRKFFKGALLLVGDAYNAFHRLCAVFAFTMRLQQPEADRSLSRGA